MSALEPGNAHCRRVLRGTLKVEPLVLSALHTLLEDERGDLVLVSIYNALPVSCCIQNLTKPQQQKEHFAYIHCIQR